MNVTGKKKAWLYLRGGTEESLEAQKTLLLDYAKEAGYEVTDIATDYSPSKSSLKLVRLAAENHDFEALLVSSWNRLGRGLSEIIDTMRHLKDQNVVVQSVKEKDISLDQALSFARFAAAMHIPDEALSEGPAEASSEGLEESEPFDMTQSF